jgi:hypothetical protein
MDAFAAHLQWDCPVKPEDYERVSAERKAALREEQTASFNAEVSALDTLIRAALGLDKDAQVHVIDLRDTPEKRAVNVGSYDGSQDPDLGANMERQVDLTRAFSGDAERYPNVGEA